MPEMGHLPAQILDKLMGLEGQLEHAHCWGTDRVDTQVGIVADVAEVADVADVVAVADVVEADT